MPAVANGTIPTIVKIATGNAATTDGPAYSKTDGADEPRTGCSAGLHPLAADELATDEPAAHELAADEPVAPAATAILVDAG